MNFPFGETVYRLRAPIVDDAHGNQVRNWTARSRVPIEGCGVAPRTSTEDNQSRTAVIVGLTVYAPAGTDLLATDRLEVRGDDYEVVGMPGDWQSPFTGWRPGLEVALEKVTG